MFLWGPGRRRVPSRVVPGAVSASLVARTGVVADPRWAPDGARIGWVEGRSGRFDLLVTGPPGAPERAPRVVTGATGVAPTRATGGGTWCWVDASRVVVVDPDGRLVLVPLDGAEPQVLVGGLGRAAAPAATVAGDRVAFVLETDDACDVAVVDVAPGAPVRRASDAAFAWDPAWSPDGRHLVWHEWDQDQMSWDSSRIVLAEVAGPAARGDRPVTRVVAGGDGIAVGQPRFAPTGDRLAWVSDESGWWNVVVGDRDGAAGRPVLPEPFEHAEPSWGVGQRSFAWAPAGDAIALCRNEEGFGRLVVARVGRDPAAEDVAKGWHHGLDWGPSGIAAVRSGARTPPAVCVAARPDGGPPTREVVARAAPAELRRDDLVEPMPVRWLADDGATLHGLLFRPVGVVAPPMVVDVHGGPTGQATVQWKPLHQHLVGAGYAVLAPNPRGSTGYGRAYAQALAGEWGVLDVADCAAGLQAAVRAGWCDPARIAVSGASSGGLVALLLAQRHPELVRAVVASYPVTDLLHLAAATHRFEAHSTDRLVGVLPQDADRFRERSPVAHAAELRVPVLLLQGLDDRVVPPEQARAFAAAMRAAGGHVEHHEYPGEGHGWSRADTLLDVYTRIDAFLGRHCGAP